MEKVVACQHQVTLASILRGSHVLLLVIIVVQVGAVKIYVAAVGGVQEKGKTGG